MRLDLALSVVAKKYQLGRQAPGVHVGSSSDYATSRFRAQIVDELEQCKDKYHGAHLLCHRCGNRWTSQHKDSPTRCPACKSHQWDEWWTTGGSTRPDPEIREMVTCQSEKPEVNGKAPRGGYAFPEKERYRRHVWGVFARHTPDPSQEHVLMMPAKEGLEIRAALDAGFIQQNIHAVDENPAIIASAKWRSQYPGVKGYGSTVSRALERIADAGHRLYAANFDFCNKFSSTLVEELKAMGPQFCCTDMPLFAITLFKGRESPDVVALLGLLGEQTRVDVAGGLFARSAGLAYKKVVVSEYRSANTMQYGIFRCWTHDAIARSRGHVQEWLADSSYMKEVRSMQEACDEMRRGLHQDRNDFGRADYVLAREEYYEACRKVYASMRPAERLYEEFGRRISGMRNAPPHQGFISRVLGWKMGSVEGQGCGVFGAGGLMRGTAR